jgi:hypothetical protein
MNKVLIDTNIYLLAMKGEANMDYSYNISVWV